MKALSLLLLRISIARLVLIAFRDQESLVLDRKREAPQPQPAEV